MLKKRWLRADSTSTLRTLNLTSSLSFSKRWVFQEAKLSRVSLDSVWFINPESFHSQPRLQSCISLCVIIELWVAHQIISHYKHTLCQRHAERLTYMCNRSWWDSKQLLWCQTMLFHLFYGLSMLWDRNGGGGRRGALCCFLWRHW